MDENHGPAARRQFLRANFHGRFLRRPQRAPSSLHSVRLNFHRKRRAFAETRFRLLLPANRANRFPPLSSKSHKSLVFHLVERICSWGRERPSRGDYRPSHGVFPVKLIRLGRPLACHPRSGAKRSGAGSEATLTRRRPAAADGAPLRALGCPLWPLPHSFILALRLLCLLALRLLCLWIRSVSPSFACSRDGRITSHPVELVGLGP